MKSRRSCLLCVGTLLWLTIAPLAPRIHAQEAKKSFALPGVVELGGSASYSYTQPVSNGTTSDGVHSVALMPYVGYFMAEGVEIVANPLGFSYVKSGSTTVIDVRLLGGVSYNIKVQPGIYPFIEGLAGLTLRSIDAGGAKATVSGFSWGGRGGVKFAVTSHGMLNVGIQYLQITLDPSGADKRFGSNELSAGAGFTVWL